MQKMIYVAVAGLACSAFGQVTIVTATGLAKATAGDGSGFTQQASTNTAGFSLTATKNFINGGHVDAQTQWGLSSWKLSGSFSSHSYAQSQGEAGNAQTQADVTFTTATDLDVEYSGGYSLNSPGGSITQELRNTGTNAYVAGGNSPNLVHILAGQYKLTADSFLPYGDASGGFSYQFRPGNDRCQYATVIGNGSFTGSTSYATFDGQATCGTSNFSPSVWYKYTALKTGPLVLSTCGSSYDTVLSIFNTGSCPSGTGLEMACNDDAPAGTDYAGSRQSYLNVNVTAGSTYLIRVSGYNNAAGDYVLNVGPVNDNCADAIQVGPGSYPFDNTQANTDGPILNSCVSGGDTQVNGDLWWVYTPLQSGFLTVDTCGSSFDTKIALYQNAPCIGRSLYLACNDDSCGLQSRIDRQAVTAGRDYYIRVGGYKTARGAGTLHVQFALPCPADFNGDGALDFFDYDDFVTCFEGGACPPGKNADFNNDTAVDFFDYDDFVAAFEAGCP